MSEPTLRRGDFRRRAVIAVILVFVVAGLIALTARDMGLTWDEAIYFGFAIRYLDWFGHLSTASFQPDSLVPVWWAGQAHPPLGSLYIALSLKLFGGGLDLISAARLGAGILFGLTAAAIFLWGSERKNEITGLMAVAVFVFMPRLFGHGHFANLEMMTVLLWLATAYAFRRGIASRGWSLVCGVLFGLALLTKINGAFLPIFLAPWGLLFHGRKALRNLVCMAAAGPIIFLAGWPALWLDPVGGVKAYLADKAQRFIVPTFYLGVVYRERVAPWHYPFVMLLATTPLIVLAGAATGAARWIRGMLTKWRERADEALLLWGFLFPVLLLAMPGVPKYDGIRLMLPAYPFLALMAAEGFEAAWSRIRAPGRRAATVAAVAAGLWLLAPITAFHPYHLCYYGELAGGPWGARRLGFETTYWSETFDQKALNFLNDRVPANGSVAFVATGEFVWRYYKAIGDARADIGEGSFSDNDWDYLVVIPRQGWFNEQEREFLATHNPVWVNGLPPFGAPPVCLIYARP